MLLLFGKKKRAYRAVLAALGPLAVHVEANDGPRPQMWDDAYALGYLLGTATHFAGISTRGRLSDEALGMVLIAAFRMLSGSDGEVLVDRALALQTAKDADFLAGARNSDKAIALALGLDPLAGDADVAAARGRVVEDGRAADGTAVAWELHEMLFFTPLRERLG